MAEYIVNDGETSTGITLNNGDAMCVSNGGVASSTVVNNKGTLDVESGGVVSNTTVNYEGTLNVQSGGVASNTTVNSLCYMRVFEGGVMIDTTVNENGRIDIFNTEERDAVVVSNVTVNSGGSIEFMNDNLRGKLTGKMTFEPGANSVSAIYARGTIDFDLRQTTAGADPLLNDFSFVTDNNLSFTLTIDGSQESGTYKLAGNAAAFGDRTITVVNASDKTLGTISLDDNLFYKNGKSYTLAVTDSTLAVAVGTAPDNIFCDDLENATKNIYAGSSAVNVNVNFMGRLHISNGGVASNTTVNSQGQLKVSGGVAIDTTVNSQGSMYVDEGGVASNTTLNSDCHLFVSEGGVASNTVASGSSAYLHISKGGVASNTVLVGSDCALFVSDGGVAIDTTVGSSCQLQISSGGVASNVTVGFWGKILFFDTEGGGKLTGKMTFEDGAQQVYANKNGAVIDFDLRQTKADADPLLNDFLYAMDSSLSFTLTVDGTQADGVYKLAGNAAIFGDRTITVVNASDETLGTLTLGGGTQTFGGVKYTLFLDSTTLAVAVGSLVFSGVVESGTKDIINPWSAVDVKVNDKGILNVYNGGTAGNTTVNQGGEMYVSAGGTATGIVENGGWVGIGDGATVTFASNTFSGLVLQDNRSATVHSGTTATGNTVDGGKMHVSNGGIANDTTVNAGGSMYISGNGTAGNTTVDQGGLVRVFDNGSANSTTVNAGGSMYVSNGGKVIGATVNPGGTLYVSKGGSALEVVENGGYCVFYTDATVTIVPNTFSGLVLQDTQSASIHSGTTATDTTVGEGCLFGVLGGKVIGATVNQGGSLNINFGGTATGATVNAGGKIALMEGVADKTTVVSGGSVTVYSSGMATDPTVCEGGTVVLSSGGKLTGKMSFETGAKLLVVETGAILDFDLTRTAAGADALVNDLSIPMNAADWFKNPMDFVYTLTVDGTQADGSYKLADGAAGFDRTITVKNTSGETLGTLTVSGGTQEFGGAKYTLIRDEDELSLLVGDPLPPEPLNDTLYLGKKEVNTDVTGSYGNRLKAAGQEIRLDQIGSVEETITFNDVPHTFNNHVEKKADDKIDVIDYAKIVLKHGAKLSFHAEATAAATFTVYSLTQDKKGKYSLKKLQTLKLTDKDNDGVFTADSKKVISLQTSGAYYVSMKYADKRKDVTEAYYNVSLNGEDKGSVFYDLGYNGDDWGDMKTRGYGGTVGKLGVIDAAGLEVDSHIVKDEWIGFGDKADYKKFTLENAAELSFTVNTSLDKGPLKLTVCRLKETVKTSGTTYSQVKVKDITLKAGKESAALNNLRLAAGDYYIKVETSSVKKSTGYGVQITDSDFYKDGDGGWNNVLLDGKAMNANEAYFYNNELLGSEGAIHLDKDGDYKTSGVAAEYIYKGETYGGFVCFGDETDFAKLTLSGTTKLTFSLSATNDATLEIFKVTQSGAKYSRKSLQTVKYKAGSEVPATSKKPLTLEAKDGVSYYVSVKATNVKKTTVDPRTYYNVSYAVEPKDACALAMQETSDALAMTDSLSFGQYASADALANASASSLADLDGISARQYSLLA